MKGFALVLLLAALTAYEHNDTRQYLRCTRGNGALVALRMRTGRRRIYNLPEQTCRRYEVKTSLSLLFLLAAGDIEQNPGPSIYPCGLCDRPVTWSQDGVCCDQCSVWQHRSCLELNSTDYNLLARSDAQWVCYKCDSLNITSFTFRSYEVRQPSYYEPLSDDSISQSSLKSNYRFDPLLASSPRSSWMSSSSQSQVSSPKTQDSRHQRSRSFKSSTSSNVFHAPKPKDNLRILTVNMQRVEDKTAEFAATLEYIKPDVVCGTESWLRGIKPGKPSSANAIHSSEVFPPGYVPYRNDRSTLGGGVFILANEDLVSTEVTEASNVEDGEIIWTKVKTKAKELFIGSFYMPHRDKSHLDKLDKSLKHVMQKKGRNILLCGDFNCPDIDWETHTVRRGASDRQVQQTLIDIAEKYNLHQVHEQPTRGNNLLDLVFTSNPTLLKASVNAPGLSDHDLVVTDF